MHPILDSARRLLATRDIEAAVLAYESCLRQGLPVEAEFAGVLVRTGRFNRAEEILGACIAKAPSNPDFLLMRATVRSRAGDLDRALEDLDRAVAIAPDQPALRLHRGTALFALERLDEAATDFETATHLEPCVAEAWANAGITRQRQGRHEEALAHLHRANSLAPDAPEVLRSMANALGPTEEALTLHRRVEGMLPRHPPSLTDHGVCLLGVGNAKAAAARFKLALEQAPGDQTALSGLYLAAIAEGNLREAQQLMDYDRLIGRAQAQDFGFEETASLRQAVLAHAALRWEPAGRSTRNGEQTTVLDLTATGPFHAFSELIHRFVGERLRQIEVDSRLQGHLWLRARPSHWRIQAWATVLHHDGNQLPHIHPAGWMSGVYYLDTGDGVEAGSGDLVFGHPPANMTLDVKFHEHRLRPEDGGLVAFPSYFLHHTTPYTYGTRPRISLAFDVIPTTSGGALRSIAS